MLAEDGKHGPLVVMREVKEAIPSDQPVKASVDRQRTHISYDPFRLRKAAPAFCDERWRSIDADNSEPALKEMAGDGLTGATS